MTNMKMFKSFCGVLYGAKPSMAMVCLQVGYAGMSIISKYALNQGMSPHVLTVYKHASAALFIAPFALLFDRKVRPKLTFSIFVKIFIMGLLEPTLDQNLSYTGMKYTSASFTAAMTNVLPAFAFVLAWAFRLEKVEIRRLHSQAKILGTLVTVLGAMLMTLIKGPIIDLPWAKAKYHQESTNSMIPQDPIKGAILIISGCFCWAGFIVLQALTLKEYPAELSLTALICSMGTVQGTVVAFAIERGNLSAWSLHFDSKLLAAIYSGVVCAAIGYYVQGVVMKTKGPVFVTAFNPLSMVVVAIMGSFILAEVMHLGRIIGAGVIVIGLYLVLWGKSKDEAPMEMETTNKEILPYSYNTQEMTVVDETGIKADIPDQEFVTVDVTKVKPPGESE